MLMPEKGYRRTLILIFYTLTALVCAYLFFKYIFKCVLPFFIGFLIAYCSRKPSLYLRRKFKFAPHFSSFVTVFFISALFFASAYFFCRVIFGELSVLKDFVTEENISNLFSEITGSVISFGEKYFPKTSAKLSADILGLSEHLKTAVSAAAEPMMTLIGKSVVSFAKFVPNAILFTGIAIFSGFYFGSDYEKISAFVKLQLSDKQNKILKDIKNEFLTTILNIIRAYAIIILMTFLELWVGFLILNINYSAVIALLTAIIDILPVFGTGTVLIPWAIILFLSKKSKTGLCILIIYVIITVVRQIAEPKILGNSVGLHPLATLASMYFGAKLGGLCGLFIFPFILIVIVGLNEKGSINLYKRLDKNKKTYKAKEQKQ